VTATTTVERTWEEERFSIKFDMGVAKSRLANARPGTPGYFDLLDAVARTEAALEAHEAQRR